MRLKRHSSYLRWSIGISCSLLGCVTAMIPSCSKPSPATLNNARPPAPSKLMRRMDDIQFELPRDWTTENAAGGLLALAPTIEAGWQANVFLEFRRDLKTRSLEVALKDYISGLRDSRVQFRESRRSFLESAAGLRYAVVEYTCQNEGTSLTQREIIVSLSAQKRLFILASSSSAMWEKYQPIFEALADSLEVAM